jgi:hypothetical protein
MLLERGGVFELVPSAGGANSNVLAPKISSTLVMAVGVVRLLMTTIGLVHLIEEMVFAQFSDEVKKEEDRWSLIVVNQTI